MARSKSKEKEMNPIFFVFCEGESEKEYIEFLRSEYFRKIIIVIEKIDGECIKRHKDNKGFIPSKDKTFLIYDLDKEENLDKLRKIKNALVLYSNPCFELWYLLHHQNQTASLSSTDCISELKKYIANYQKGTLNEKHKQILKDNQNVAISRAKKLPEYENPSTNLYEFLEILDVMREKR